MRDYSESAAVVVADGAAGRSVSNLPPQVGADLIWAERRAEPQPAPALFLDRDGVIVEEVHHLHRPEDVQLIPGVVDVVAAANARNLHVVVVTNQSGIGQGLFGWPDFAAVQARILSELAAGGARIDAVMACPFHPDAAPPYAHPDHPARKPNPGMLLTAAAMLQVDLAGSWIVGDHARDIDAGRRAGLAGGVHVMTGYGSDHRDTVLAEFEADYPVLLAESAADALTLLPLLREP